jgi:hypothetical protein
MEFKTQLLETVLGEQGSDVRRSHLSVSPERHVESAMPGELLCQDTLFVGNLKGIGKGLSPHAVVDTYGSHACFGLAWFRIYVEVPKTQRGWQAVDR